MRPCMLMFGRPALLKGKRYHLTISEVWQDVHGQELLLETAKEFGVVEAYHQHIEVNEWLIQKPEINSLDTLGIKFDRVMDHALINL